MIYIYKDLLFLILLFLLIPYNLEYRFFDINTIILFKLVHLAFVVFYLLKKKGEQKVLLFSSLINLDVILLYTNYCPELFSWEWISLIVLLQFVFIVCATLKYLKEFKEGPGYHDSIINKDYLKDICVLKVSLLSLASASFMYLAFLIFHLLPFIAQAYLDFRRLRKANPREISVSHLILNLDLLPVSLWFCIGFIMARAYSIPIQYMMIVCLIDFSFFVFTNLTGLRKRLYSNKKILSLSYKVVTPVFVIISILITIQLAIHGQDFLTNKI